MAEGNVVPCTQISNNEIVLGNVNKTPVDEIWNGEEYKKLRQMHITGNFPKGHKCIEKCDQVKLFEYLKKIKINNFFFFIKNSAKCKSFLLSISGISLSITKGKTLFP